MNPSNKLFLDKLVRVTETHLPDETFGVTQLAREMGISRSLLYRKVKALTGKSISQFIREQRLKKAMDLLKQNSMNISEIAYATGFGSVAYFSRCFHEFFGCQPGEAKKRLAGEIAPQDRADDNQENNIPKKEQAEVSETEVNKKSRISIKSMILPVAGVLISVAIFIVILSLNWFPDKSIGILPFSNDTGDPANNYFNDGITEAIRDRLATIRDLEVKSRVTTDSYKNISPKRIRQIAREMKVRYIVEGSSQKSGDEVLVSVQLIEARKDRHLISKQYEKKYEDVFSLYAEIALDVANEIRALITPEERKLIVNQPLDKLEVTRLLITGEDNIDRGGDNRNQRLEYLKKAETCYRRALQIDSTCSDAYTGLSRAYWYMGKMDSALFLVNRAIRFNPENAKAYLQKSDIFNWFRMTDEKEESLRLALKYDPKNAWAVHVLGGLYYSKGEFARAFEYLIKTAKMTSRLDPSSSRYNLFMAEWNTLHIFRSLFALGFYEDAKRIAGEWLRLSYDDQWGYYYNIIWGGVINCRFEEAYQIGMDQISQKHFYMLLAMLFLGKYEEMMKYVNEITANGTDQNKQPDVHHILGFTFLMNGQKKIAEKYFNSAVYYVDTLIASHPENKKSESVYAIMSRYWNHPLVILLSVSAVRGEKEKALGYLSEIRKNYLASDLQVVTFLKLFPMFDNIRNEPEFQDYLHAAENHYLSERQKVEKLLKEEGIIQ